MVLLNQERTSSEQHFPSKPLYITDHSLELRPHIATYVKALFLSSGVVIFVLHITDILSSRMGSVAATTYTRIIYKINTEVVNSECDWHIEGSAHSFTYNVLNSTEP